MTRDYLDKTIANLQDELLEVGQMVANATTQAVHALLTTDRDLSRQIYQDDRKINSRRFAIENDCLITIATQQPLATDLRVLASIIEVVTELERMGDYAKGIAKINLLIDAEELQLEAIDGLAEMSEITTRMLLKALQAFVRRDVETARSLPAEDDAVDEIFNRIYHNLVVVMIENRDLVEMANHLQWAVHNIERMSDRVINICERTIFIETGIMNELEESDDESVVKI